MRLITSLFCLLALSTTPSAGLGQPFDRSNEGFTRRYLTERQAEFARRAALLREQGLLEELKAMRSLVFLRMPPVEGQPGIEPDTRAALNRVFAERIALQLVELGRTAREVEALEKRGFDLVRIVSEMGPSPKLIGPAVLSEDVVVGEIVAIDTKAELGDARLTSITFRASETLSGTMKPGERVIVRLASGCKPDGQTCSGVSSEPDVRSLRAGERFLLFLSSAAYVQQARVKGHKVPSGGRYAFNMTELIRVEGERLHGTHGFPGGTLAQARAELAPFARAQKEKKRSAGDYRRRAVTK
jgi:hypothetical protein